MSSSRPVKSHAGLWVSITLALPVIYLLSVSPLWQFSLRTWGAHQPDAVLRYSAPYSWVLHNTPLKGPLMAYDAWCWEMASRLGPLRPS